LGSGLTAAEVALATIEERGTAVGFWDFRVKEGVGKEVVVMGAFEPEELEAEVIPLLVVLLVLVLTELVKAAGT
jgi:hypothetical protein